MPTYPDRPPAAPQPLQWFALSIAGGFFLGLFVYWAFAALFALSLGALATAFDQARLHQRVSIWLAVPGPAVFAFVAGSFLQGFSGPPEIDLRARLIAGALEAGVMMFSGGVVPIEGVQRLSPWPHIAGCWIGLTAVTLSVGSWLARRRVRVS